MWGQSEMDEEFSRIVSSLSDDPKMPSWSQASKRRQLLRGLAVLGVLACMGAMMLFTSLFWIAPAVVCFIAAVMLTYAAYSLRPRSTSPKGSASGGRGRVSARTSWYERLEQRWQARRERDL